MCTHMWKYINICMYICIYICKYTHIHMYIFLCMFVHTSLYVFFSWSFKCKLRIYFWSSLCTLVYVHIIYVCSCHLYILRMHVCILTQGETGSLFSVRNVQRLTFEFCLWQWVYFIYMYTHTHINTHSLKHTHAACTHVYMHVCALIHV